jgi:hypothetical protein
MARNHKLTDVLQGRSLTGARREDQSLIFDLNDGSTMWVKTADAEAAALELQNSAVVRAVRQKDTSFTLDFETGESLSLQTAEATSCVLVRDKNRVLEYAD